MQSAPLACQAQSEILHRDGTWSVSDKGPDAA
jgi:hypothetical protein